MRLSSRWLLLALVPAVFALVASSAGAVPDVGAKKLKKPSSTSFGQVHRATTTSLTFTWPKPKKPRGKKARKHWIKPKGYEVFRGTDFAMTGATRIARTKSRTYTATGLRPGQEYCFQVRAYSKKQVVRKVRSGKHKKKIKKIGYGRKSQRFCKAPIAAQGRGTGGTYNVVTYNMCTDACNRGGGIAVPWATRRPLAARLINRLSPDVLGLQETEPPGRNTTGSGIEDHLPGMRIASGKSGKVLLYRTSRFVIATDQSGERAGYFQIGRDPRGERYATWAELIDQTNQQHVIFVNVHTTPGEDQASIDADRRRNVEALFEWVRQNNPQDLPVVFLGDFNSHSGKKYDSPTQVMRKNGYTDGYDLAQSLVLPNHNSGNQGSLTPLLGVARGYHLDHVWVRAPQSRVLEWRNGGDLANGRWRSPLPSNHNPVRVRVQLDLH